LRYHATGSGPALVLQHGFLCGPAYWRQTVDALSHRFRIIVPTLPGFAGHDAAPALDSISGFADYLLAVLDDAGIQRFHLLGHSMGGMIAQEVALRAGSRVGRLVLFGTGPIGEMPGRFETLEESGRRVAEEGAESVIRRTVATWFVKGSEDPSCASAVATARQASMEAILGGYRAMQHWRGLERLADIPNRTLIVWGDRDRSYRRDQVELLHQGIVDSGLVIMPGCSHNAHLEMPREFVRIIGDFLAAAP
jgi:pimeloyl-ACP methyl ester carboxylesterase